jgi:uncharacterized protein (DUF433 family)
VKGACRQFAEPRRQRAEESPVSNVPLNPSILNEPLFEAADVARLVGMTPTRVRRWLHGYEYRWTSGAQSRTGRQPPVVGGAGQASKRHASFLDLVELLFVRAFLSRSMSLQRVRRAADEASRRLGVDHPFSRQRFFTDGRGIYLAFKDSGDTSLLELLSGGQWVMAPVVLQTAEQLAFDELTGFATRWWPLGREKRVVIDPAVAFGAPSIDGRGVKTANVYDLFEAERRSTQAVSSWLKLEPEEVVAAVDFERRLRAA